MVKVKDADRKRKYKKRRSKIEMINAVREADLLIARGVAVPSARHAVKLSKASYDLHSELLKALTPPPAPAEEVVVGGPHYGLKPSSEETFREKAERIFEPEPERPQGMQAWECPKCGRVNAIWKGTCDCWKEN